MSKQIEREVLVSAARNEVWEILTADGWLADQVSLELTPGGAASFCSEHEEKRGWIEEVAPARQLTFWWESDGAPATRVEITLTDEPEGTRLRIRESRPLEKLDLVGMPLPSSSGRRFGPALVAAA